jgi:BolA protein
MSIEQTIKQKLAQAFTPVFLEVINESNNHNVPAGSESHFKVVIVSDRFDGLRLLQRHRLVNETLVDELANHIHALAIHTYTPEQWQQNSENLAPASPNCMGGGH